MTSILGRSKPYSPDFGPVAETERTLLAYAKHVKPSAVRTVVRPHRTPGEEPGPRRSCRVRVPAGTLKLNRGSPGAVDMETSGRAPWSPPCPGITEGLDRTLFLGTSIGRMKNSYHRWPCPTSTTLPLAGSRAGRSGGPSRLVRWRELCLAGVDSHPRNESGARTRLIPGTLDSTSVQVGA